MIELIFDHEFTPDELATLEAAHGPASAVSPVRTRVN